MQGGAFSILYIDGGKYNGSYKIPYEAIVPRKGECDNLVVPVCVSASHIAFTSLRMEPVWMVLGESAGVAAAMAAGDEKLKEKENFRAKMGGALEQRLDIRRKSSWRPVEQVPLPRRTVRHAVHRGHHSASYYFRL